MEILQILTSSHALLAGGFCLLVFGVIFRNFARNTQRTLFYRKQHSLHHHTLAEANAETARKATAWEKHFSKIANAIVLLGLAAVIASFFRK